VSCDAPPNTSTGIERLVGAHTGHTVEQRRYGGRPAVGGAVAELTVAVEAPTDDVAAGPGAAVPASGRDLVSGPTASFSRPMTGTAKEVEYSPP